MTSTDSDSTVAAWCSSAGFFETPVIRRTTAPSLGETETTFIFPFGSPGIASSSASASRPSRWNTNRIVASCFEPSAGVIVRSVSTRIVFSPRIMAERSALKSRNVKPVPSMFVVVPFWSRTSRPKVSGWPGSYCCGAM